MREIKDKKWWDGFNKASELVFEVIHGMDWSLAYTAPDVLSLIEDELELYKKREA